MIQVKEMTREEEIEMYMKSSKRELAEMLVEANFHLKNKCEVKELDNQKKLRVNLKKEKVVKQSKVDEMDIYY